MKRLFLALIASASMGVAAHSAGVELYLLPRAERGEGTLMMSDIALVRGERDSAARIGAVIIDPRLHADGYLDRSDIAAALGEGGVENVRIHGAGVRVVTRDAEGDAGLRAPAVRKGTAITFRAVRGNVFVETTGVAMRDGAAGEIIPVQLRGKAVSRGRIVDARTVEFAL